jgi:threonine dehydratase
VPEAGTEEKIARLCQWGVQVVRSGKIWNDSNALALNNAKYRDCACFHPFADPAIVAVQGATALEFLEDAAAQISALRTNLVLLQNADYLFV